MKRLSEVSGVGVVANDRIKVLYEYELGFCKSVKME